jgi:hypothetical protein
LELEGRERRRKKGRVRKGEEMGRGEEARQSNLTFVVD